jgi:dienelactone hydrolase
MVLSRNIAGEAEIPVGDVILKGNLKIPKGASGIVVFAHGSGSSRHSPRNKFVAEIIQQKQLGTLLFDLLTPEEEQIDIHTRYFRFDIELLAKRLVAVAEWLSKMEEIKHLPIGFFGSSTGAGAALVAAAHLGKRVRAVVSRGGRPDLAGEALCHVKAAVLLIVGGADEPVIEINEIALAEILCEKELKIVPGATHLFEEPGALEIVAEMAGDWFVRHFQPKRLTSAVSY